MIETLAGIPLRARDGSIRAFALVDASDVAWLSQWRWSLTAGYASRGVSERGRRRIVLMHRALLGLEAGDAREVDHINQDRLDNRRANLRAVPRAANRQNVSARSGSSSRHRGVCWDKRRGRWMAKAQLDGRMHFIGYFTDEDEAGRAASAFRDKHMPFAVEAAL